MTTTNQPRKPGTPTAISAAAASTKPMAAATTAPPPEQQEGLPCPRCDSTNTKFCYYNNYNFSQPRHFCKSCRRYWTHGGTLRDIPVGGATRKNAKRSRTTQSSSSSSTTSISDLHHSMNSAATTALPVPAAPVFLPIAATDVGPCAYFKCPDQDFKVSGGSSNSSTTTSSNSFTSLLSNTQGVVNAGGLWALGGFGLGLGIGPDVGFGPARVGVWPFAGIPAGDSGRIASGLGGDENNNIGGGAEAAIGNTWQFESGENGGLANGSGGGGSGADWFSWPDLAISTPGTGLK